MAVDQALIPSIFEGWHTYQTVLIQALRPLHSGQLALRAAPHLRSIGEIATHVIGARARWFYQLMGEGGDDFARMAKWDRRGMPQRSAEELVTGLAMTWKGMQAAITRWTSEDWQQTYPGEDDNEPKVITRQWVIWHLIEHDLHHSGEISLTLGMHGVEGLNL
jgi:uncharacterized damage-inducible protein DinB